MRTETVLDLFYRSVEQWPNHIAIQGDNRAITYFELDRKSDAIAAYLRRRKVGKGDFIPIFGHRSIDLIIAELGVMKTSASYVPVDNKYPKARKLNIASQCLAPVILATEAVDTDCLVEKDVIAVFDILNEEKHDLTDDVSVFPNDIIYTIFTSGTTGQPKGVLIEHHSLVNLIKWHNDRFMMTPQSRTTLMAGVGFDVSQWEIWSTLSAGATIYLLDEAVRISTEALLGFYNRHGITHAYIPAVMVGEFVRQPQPDKQALQFLFSAGEKLHPVDTERLAFTLVDYYGPTETTIYATCRIVRNTADPQLASSIGFPVADMEVFVLDDNLDPVADGDTGELFIAGNGLARGYLGRPDLTAERFITVPSMNLRAYRSGDLARRLPDGSIQFLGRADDQVKIRGNRVELGEIEVALLRSPWLVAAVVMLDAFSELQGKRLVAFVVPRDKEEVSGDFTRKLTAQLRNEVPDYMIPARYVLLDSIPYNANGKTDRKALYELASVQRDDEVKKFQAGSQEELLIAEVWSRFLGHSDFGLDDNFFEVGGHSLLAISLLTEITAQLGVKTYIRDLYEHGTIHGLAAVLEARKGSRSAPLDGEPVHELQYDVRLPLKFDIPEGFSHEQMECPRHILLTGVTGFVGIHLLDELLSSSEAEVHCLVRASNPVLARKRIEMTAERYEIHLGKNIERVRVYTGELSHELMGLADSTYKMLSEKVDMIYHSASSVNFIQPYSYMKKDNVEGLKQIIEFAANMRSKALILLSTISVYSWGHLHTGKTVMYEADDIDQNLPAVATDLGYVRSKWVMEKIADLAASKGLPLMTFRLGYATCHSRTGAFAGYQWWGRLIQTCMNLKMVPDLKDLREGLTTVDYMVRAIGCISRKPQALGKKFNLIPSPEKTSPSRIFSQGCKRVAIWFSTPYRSRTGSLFGSGIRRPPFILC
ncbi:non-ribosomal peptide synthetase [Pseudomonas agarici]|uniref:non-ribosomal peptide synthetase n=1 Tax=Pseudomonas agarici TaxID=46677 RepID=UPI000A568F48|nr:amino acid adenylation domain-containing protein [Pseudomonas agarici]